MLLAPRKIATVALRTVPVSVLLALLFLPLQHSIELSFGHKGIVAGAKFQLTSVLPHQRHRVDLGRVGDWREQPPSVNLVFLRTDYKQNLLVWPVVAENLTRSPPSKTLS